MDFEIVSRARWDFVERSSFHQPSLTHPTFSPQKTPQQAPGDGGGAQSLASAAVTALQTCHLAGEPKATCVSFHVADFCFSYSLPRPPPSRPVVRPRPFGSVAAYCRQLLPSQRAVLGLFVPVSGNNHRVPVGHSSQAPPCRQSKAETPGTRPLTPLCSWVYAKSGVGAFVGLGFVGVFFSYIYETDIYSVPSQAHVVHHPSSTPPMPTPQPAPWVQLML